MSATQVDFLLAGIQAAGVPLTDGYVYTYAAGTSTVKTCWTDKDKVTAAANPVQLDANGSTQLYCDGIYKFVIKDVTLTTIYTWDNLIFLTDNSIANVQSYGAVGDGATDDSTEIQAAIDSGARYIIVPYTASGYLITSGLTMANYQSLIGYNSKLISTAVANFNMVTVSGKSGVVVTGLHFYSASVTDTAVPVRGVYISQSHDCEVTGNIFEGLNYGVHLTDDVFGDATNPTRNRIHHNLFKSAIGDTNGGYGILLVRCLANTVDHNIFSPGTFGRHAIYISAGARQNTIDHNIIKGSKMASISFNSGTTAADIISENVVDNNVVIGQATYAAYQHAVGGSGAVHRNTISNNIIKDSDEYGIFFQAANATMYPQENKIIGNQVLNSADIGIYISDGVNNHIASNTIKDTQGGSDINISQSLVTGGGQYNVIQGNMMRAHVSDPVTYHCVMGAATANNVYRENTPLDAIAHESDGGTGNIWNYEYYGSLVWNPGSLADGVGETSGDITVTNAAVSMAVAVYPPYNTQGLLITGYVTSANTVNIRIQNELAGGAVDLASGTWRVKAYK